MTVNPGRRFSAWIVPGGHLAILSAAALTYSDTVFAFALIVTGAISFFAWIGSVRRSNVVQDHPVSKIVSAAQGYVELAGIAMQPGKEELRDPITRETCLWFRVETWREQRMGDNWIWTKEKEAQSSRPIGLGDGTGLCLVLPEGAEFQLGGPRKIPFMKNWEHRLWRIRQKDRLYAIGQFETRGEVRLGAYDEAGNNPDIERGTCANNSHVIRMPDDDRPFIVSNYRFDAVGNGYWLLSVVHLTLCCLGLGAAIYLAH